MRVSSSESAAAAPSSRMRPRAWRIIPEKRARLSCVRAGSPAISPAWSTASNSVVLCARAKPLRREDPDYRGIPRQAPLGNVLGFGVMTYTLDTAHLMLLAVHPHVRRRGIATKLLHWLEKTAFVAGIHRVELEVRARNTGARQFYREHGYHERDYLDRYYSGIESAFRMTRNLRQVT